jgi:GDPmannose 4,6-dehydratase
MHLMLQQKSADDYVISTGTTHSVAEFCRLAFDRVGLSYTRHVQVDPTFYRPAEVDVLVGDARKAISTLGWKPTYTFEELVYEMVDSDVSRLLGIHKAAVMLEPALI